MTANMMHLLRLTFRFQLSSGEMILSAVLRVKLESAMQVGVSVPEPVEFAVLVRRIP
jgi:hypothetical protein